MRKYMEVIGMKVKKNYVLKEIADQIVVIPIEEEAVKFNGIISLNNSGKRLFEKLQVKTSETELAEFLMSIYDVNEDKARKDVSDFIAIMREHNLLEE